MSPDDCIFCKIARAQVPASTVLDTADAVAFLDVNPLAPGHTLLIPKRHFARLTDMPDDLLARIAPLLSRLGRAISQATGTDALNVLQNNGRSAGQVVEHVHFHLIPRAPGDDLGYRWNAKTYPPGGADELRRAINAALA